MDPLLIGAGAVAGLSGLGNLLSNQGANSQALQMEQEQLQRWMDLNIPDPEQQKLALQTYQSTGKLTPAFQAAIANNPSEFQKIVQNASYKSAQDQALKQLQEIGNSGGMRLQDKAALQEAMLGAQTRASAARKGIQDQAAQRGTGGSGFELAGKLNAQQAAGNQESENDLKIAANAQDRALQAILSGGNLATTLGQNDIANQQAKASAADRINMFNTENLRNVNAGNTASQNAANMYNTQNAQNIGNMNTQLKNQQQIYNKQLLQQQYENELQKLNGENGVINNVAGITQQGGKMAGNAISNIGGAVSGGLQNASFWDNYFNKTNPNPNPAPPVAQAKVPYTYDSSQVKMPDEYESYYS